MEGALQAQALQWGKERMVVPLVSHPEGNHDIQLLLFAVVVYEPPGWDGD